MDMSRDGARYPLPPETGLILQYKPLPPGFKTVVLPPREISDTANHGIATINTMIRQSSPDATFLEYQRGPTGGNFEFRNIIFAFSSILAGLLITLAAARDVLQGIIDAAWDPQYRYHEPARILIQKREDDGTYFDYGFCYFLGDAWEPPEGFSQLFAAASNGTEGSSSIDGRTKLEQPSSQGTVYEVA